MKFLLLTKSLRAVDALVLIFAGALSALDIIYVQTTSAMFLLLANMATCAGILYVARNRERRRWIGWLHDWYAVPIIFLTFKEVYVIIQSMARPDLDPILIAIDRWMFGIDPTVFLSRFSSPFITEVLQIAYTGFYFIMLTLGIELYVRKEYDRFNISIFTISYGFYLSYIGYLLFPGVGPRFTLHDFHSLSSELPGFWMTETLRNFINAGESIPKGAMNAYALAQRDVFPSGHTEMTLIVLYFAAKYKLKSRYILYVAGALLIIGTVYLRYHYVIDVIAGALFMLFTVRTAPKLTAWWERLHNKNS